MHHYVYYCSDFRVFKKPGAPTGIETGTQVPISVVSLHWLVECRDDLSS